MARRFLLGLLFALLLASCTTAQQKVQDSLAAKPLVIGSTWAVSGKFSRQTFHLYEEDGRLTVDVKTRYHVRLPDGPYVEVPDNATPDQMAAFRRKLAARFPGKKIFVPDELDNHYSVVYGNVDYVKVDSDLLDRYGGKRYMQIEDSDGRYLSLTLPTEAEAAELAEYVARKSNLGLELTGDAWRVRRPFYCPQDAGPGCRDFKELLDHGDPEIAEYFYSRDANTHTYACFGGEKSRFFIVQYEHIGDFGTLLYGEYDKQQAARSEVREIRWLPGDSGRITESTMDVQPGAKPQVLGWIDSSSLSYETKFPNRENTTTQYSLSIRWSTGRYTESFSGKDKKGEPWNLDKTGGCAKLN